MVVDKFIACNFNTGYCPVLYRTELLILTDIGGTKVAQNDTTPHGKV